jgi:hypothetical protein
MLGGRGRARSRPASWDLTVLSGERPDSVHPAEIRPFWLGMARFCPAGSFGRGTRSPARSGSEDGEEDLAHCS